MGNPGKQYAKTRHNLGRRVVEELAWAHQASWQLDRSFKARWAEIHSNNLSFLAATPDSYMNLSGESVHRLVTHFKINFKSDLLVVADDAVLPFGQLRLRGEGSDGGHRGLGSIEASLASQNYARLRIGIAPSTPSEKPLEEYVLEEFLPGEEKQIDPLLERAAHACFLWLAQPLEKVMNEVNQPAPRPSSLP